MVKNYDFVTHLSHSAQLNTQDKIGEKEDWLEFLEKLKIFFDTPAPLLVEFAKERFINDLKKCYFSQSSCLTIYQFCKSLVQNTGSFFGKNLELLPYQVFIIANLYGLLIRNQNGSFRRKYREAIISVPRKNGKSTFISALTLHALFEEPAAAIYLIAQSKNQAKEVYNIICEIISQTPSLRKVLTSDFVFRGANSSQIKYYDRRIIPLASNDVTLDGLNPSLVVYDEFFATQNEALYNVMKTAFQARRNPLMILMGSHTHYIDGFGYNFEKHKKEQFISGVDNRTFFLVYEPDEDDDLHSPEVWKKVNPALGVIKDGESFFDDYQDAVSSEQAWLGFTSKILNVWPSSKEESWLGINWADKLNKIPQLTENAKCFIGIDLSLKWDLTAATIVTDKKEIMWLYWVASDTIEERKRTENSQWGEWVKNGYSFICEGKYISIEQVWEDIKKVISQYNLEPIKVIFDHYRAPSLKNLVTNDNIETVIFKPYPNEVMKATNRFFDAYIRGDFSIVPNPITDICFSNAVIIEAGGGIRLVKSGRRRAKIRIDGAITAIIAYSAYVDFIMELFYPVSDPIV